MGCEFREYREIRAGWFSEGQIGDVELDVDL